MTVQAGVLGTKILIVDDDDIALEMLFEALSQAGYDVDTASDGDEALEVIAEGDCRLVICDWDMPRMNGVELCRAIRSRHHETYVYFILLTARNRAEDTVAGMTAGADDFISKPFDTSELMVRVRAGERILSLETRDVTIFAMAKLAESRDPETGAHLERVRKYSRVLADELAGRGELGFGEQMGFSRLIYQTSPLHDIGKVAIPDCVLLKPGRLDDREFEIMKTHTTVGARTLEAALRQHPRAEFLSMARDIALTHHERYDGHGYPQGLSGNDIPISGRIVALADVFDALTSRRIYKTAFALDVTRSTIVKESGSHFDPRVVEAFLAREEDFVKILNAHPEHGGAVAA